MAKRQTGGGNRSHFPDGFRILQGTQEYISYVEHSSIRVWPSDVPAHFPMHEHSAIEIIMPHRGVPVYRMSHQEFRVQPNEVLILPSGCLHELTEPEDILRYLILFEPNPLTILRDMPALSAMMCKPIHLQTGDELCRPACNLLMKVVKCYTDREPMWNAQCYSYLTQLYVLLGKRYLQFAAPEGRERSAGIEPAIFNSVMTYINEHYMEDISLEDAALFAGFSKCYFSRIFKQFSGLTFSEYLTLKRLNAATNLLANATCPIGEVARLSGFSSSSTFNRIFRERHHCTPTQYRMMNGPILPLELRKE